MDSLDEKLIALLRHNARTSIATLAKKLGVARGTIQNRLSRLEAGGTIVGYTLRFKCLANATRIRGLMTIATEGRPAELIAGILKGEPAIAALHTTNGRWDLVAEIQTETLQELDQVLLRIGRIDGVSNSETSLLLSTYKC